MGWLVLAVNVAGSGIIKKTEDKPEGTAVRDDLDEVSLWMCL